MKRIGFLYEQLCSYELIETAITEASRGKQPRQEVAIVLQNRHEHILQLLRMFEEECVKFTPYFEFNCYDPHSKKTREIRRPAFYPDQIIHWCVVLVLKPVFMRGMYKYCSGSIPGRGAVYGCRAVRKWINQDPTNTTYVAQLDVRKFYDSINHDVLMGMWRKKIKDRRMLTLIEKLLQTAPGVPIGNYTSQWMANFFLQGLDHFIKETLGVKYYIRYIDDLVLFASTPKELHTAVREIVKFLQPLGLTLKANWQVYPLAKRGLDFLGFVFKPNHTLIRARNFLAFTRQARLLRQRLDEDYPVSFYEAASMLSRVSLIRRGNHICILQKHLPFVYQKQLRRIVGKGMRKRNQLKKQGGYIDAICSSRFTGTRPGNLITGRPPLPKRTARGTVFYGVSESVPSGSGLCRHYPRKCVGFRKRQVYSAANSTHTRS